MALSLRFVITAIKLRQVVADDGAGGFTTTKVYDVYGEPEFHNDDSGHPNYAPWDGEPPTGQMLLTGVTSATAAEFEVGGIISVATDDTV